MSIISSDEQYNWNDFLSDDELNEWNCFVKGFAGRQSDVVAAFQLFLMMNGQSYFLQEISDTLVGIQYQLSQINEKLKDE